jgi:hypothetical protein
LLYGQRDLAERSSPVLGAKNSIADENPAADAHMALWAASDTTGMDFLAGDKGYQEIEYCPSS